MEVERRSFDTTPDKIFWLDGDQGLWHFYRKTGESYNIRGASETIIDSCKVVEGEGSFEDRLIEILESLNAEHVQKSEGNVL